MASTYYQPVGGNGTYAVNSQLLASPMAASFYPGLASAPFYKGNGQGPPTVPINYMMGTSSNSSDQTAAAAAANPFDPTASPLPWALGALIVGILGLRYIHWRH